MKFDEVLTILNDVPDYQVFLTVDELKASTHQLANRYPNTVEVLHIGHSRQGDPIKAIKTRPSTFTTQCSRRGR
jgi:hypothetical protein